MVITSAGHYLSGAIEALKAKDPHAKIAMVYSDDPFSKAVLAAAAAAGAKTPGFNVVMDESYSPSTTDFGPIVNKIISSNADAFMGGGHYSDGATLARQMHDQKGEHEVGVDPGGAGRRQIRRAGARRAGRDRAVAMGACRSITSRNSGRPPRNSPRRSRTNSTPRRIITRRRAIRAAWSCSTPSSRPARSIRKRWRRRSTPPTSPPSSATSSS